MQLSYYRKREFLYKIIMLLLVLSMIFLTTSCGSDFEGHVDEEIDYKKESVSGNGANSHKIGVAMPTKNLQRWIQDGQNIEQSLREKGYAVDLQYADNDVGVQATQITSMIQEGCEVLVIASIDGTKLTECLAAAREAGVVVIAYDRLIMNTDAVSYYVSFDNRMVGRLQGEYIEKALDLKNAKGPFSMEVFSGDPGDNNSKFYYDGAMEVLKPYMDSGKLLVPSGQIMQQECSIDGWSAENASNRMKDLLTKYYADGKQLDAVLSPNDSIANGVANILSEKYKGNYPVLTGQDCDINSVKDILKGRQSMSVFKDTRILADKASEMVAAVIDRKDVPVNDTTSYDNGIGIIPSFLCEVVYTDADNYKEILLDSGYYTEDQLK